MNKEQSMKKIIVTVLLVLSITINAFAADCSFPPVENNVESVRNAFSALVSNVLVIAFIEAESSWTYSVESISSRYHEHLDELLDKMSCNKVKKYVETIDQAIQKIDYQSMTKREITSFNHFLNNAEGDYRRFDDKDMMIIWKEITKFQTWKDCFTGEYTILPAFMFNQDTCKTLYEMIEEDIPQKLVPEYTKKLNKFLSDWGISYDTNKN